jgi:hypothetical protein
MNTKESNPKDIIGSGKLPMHLVSGAFKAYVALGLTEGMFKYGAHNYRIAGVRASIYLDALERHLESFKNGEWADPKTKVPHLASMGACINILVDAHEAGVITDDRPPSSPVGQLIRDFSDRIPALRDLFSEHAPKHYSIADKRKGNPKRLRT